jgi:hypothetical protein
MILGFGSTETEVEQREGQWVTELLKEELSTAPALREFFHNQTIDLLRGKLKDRSESLKAEAETYRTATSFPDRYSTYWFSILHDACNVVVIFRFSHYNRRHPFSPDGWAMWQHVYLHYVDLDDVKE